MKKITLLLSVGILALSSCGGSTTGAGTSSSTDWFEHNGTRFDAQSAISVGSGTGMLITASRQDNNNGNVTYEQASILYYSKDSMLPTYQGTSAPTFLTSNYIITKNPLKSSNGNCAKTVNVVKNTNGSYTVTGQYFMYESYDSTKRHTIKLNFTTK